MNPEVIIIPQPVEFGAEEFRERLRFEQALQEVLRFAMAVFT